ncbi:hypothetical protein GCM10010371_50350 [Streptomyces subrutilus]|uniref:Uncharacterized protein n=1 Tax=Streptomyces subrutilus TaxID=36818 RepID=A0A5P2UQ62_9ACTN|nr:hypothetical protein [Streptomyces subrutilus]QEU79654.1 hypothetical protein CP968_16125 [Streptomyces subrutilus]GGZ84503.1 hypothetical protein GCM10010371_50350 [Streptomyces subrutilus]
MEIVYASLTRRHTGNAPHESDAARVVDALWAHALPGDGLQHASARPEHDRIDLLLYLMTKDASTAPAALCRAHALIERSRRNSLGLRRRYLASPPHSREADHTCS